MVNKTGNWLIRSRGWLLIFIGVFITFPHERDASAQEAAFSTDYSKGPSTFPGLFRPYRAQPLPPIELENSLRLQDLIQDDKLALSLSQAFTLALENNLDIEVNRFLLPISQTDVLRARSGQAARGFAGARIPGGLNSGVLGAGVSNAGGGGGVGSAGGITGGGGAVQVGPAGTFDPTVVVNFSRDKTEVPLNTQVVAGSPSVTTKSLAGSESYSQLFPTGTSLILGLTGIGQQSTQSFLRFDPAVITRFSAAVNQPLLRGFGLLPNQRFLIVARNNEQVADSIFRLKVSDVLVEVATLYRDLAGLRKSLQVAQQSLKAAKNLYAQNKNKVDVGTMSQIDIVAAQSEVANSQRDVVIATTNLQQTERSLKNVLMRRMTPNLEHASIVLTDPLPTIGETKIPTIETALATAFKNRQILQQANIAEQNQKVATQFTKNGLLPNLSVFGLYTASGLAGDTPSNSAGAGDSLRQIFDRDFPESAVGLSFAVPIRNRAAQADDLRARLEYDQRRVATQQTRNQITLEVHSALIGLQQGGAQVEAAQQAVVFAQQSFDKEELRLQQGLSTPYQVILLARDLTSARRAEVEALASYAKAVIEMQRAQGTILEDYGIQISDAVRGAVSREAAGN